MTLAARLEDFEVTLEHMLMDVFVSVPRSFYCSAFISNYKNRLIHFGSIYLFLSTQSIIAVADETQTYVPISFQMLCRQLAKNKSTHFMFELCTREM